jgi:hypothetical protein
LSNKLDHDVRVKIVPSISPIPSKSQNMDSSFATHCPGSTPGNAIVVENCCDAGVGEHPYKIVFGTSYGSASIFCAETGIKTCSCRVSASLSRPIPEKPNEGRFSIFVEAREIGGTELSYIREIIDKVYRNHVVDTESLCVLNGELVR